MRGGAGRIKGGETGKRNFEWTNENYQMWCWGLHFFLALPEVLRYKRHVNFQTSAGRNFVGRRLVRGSGAMSKGTALLLCISKPLRMH